MRIDKPSTPLSGVPAAVFFMTVAGFSVAQDVVLREGVDDYAGTDDNSLYHDRPDNTNGGFPMVFSGATVNSVRRALIRFDLADVSLPPEPFIVELTLVLERSGLFAEGDDTYTLHRLTSSWGEGTAADDDINGGGQGVPADAGDATWSSNFHEVSLWNSEGGDYIAIPSASLSISRWDSVFPENNIYTFSGPNLAEDVKLWKESTGMNHGWILIGDETVARNARRFWSSEAEDLLVRPQLKITTITPAEEWVAIF